MMSETTRETHRRAARTRSPDIPDRSRRSPRAGDPAGPEPPRREDPETPAARLRPGAGPTSPSASARGDGSRNARRDRSPVAAPEPPWAPRTERARAVRRCPGASPFRRCGIAVFESSSAAASVGVDTCRTTRRPHGYQAVRTSSDVGKCPVRLPYELPQRLTGPRPNNRRLSGNGAARASSGSPARSFGPASTGSPTGRMKLSLRSGPGRRGPSDGSRPSHRRSRRDSGET